MNNIVHDSMNNDLRSFSKEPFLEENRCEPNLLGPVVDPEGDLSTKDNYVPDYSCQNDPLKTFNEEAGLVNGGTNPVEAYLSDILLRLREYFLYFDGTTKSFRKCQGASLESSVEEQPDGAEGFSFKWFGIALAIVRDGLRQESKLRRELNTLRPLPMTIYEARENFVSGLNFLTFHVMKSWQRFCYSSSSRENLPYIGSVSKKILDNWVISHQLPDSISSRYPNEFPERQIGSLEDLEILLMADAGAWIASFFPLYHSLSQNVYTSINLIWIDKFVHQFDAEEFAYQIYTLCKQKSLSKNKDGLSRGIIVPKSWLTGLLGWLVHLLLHSDEEWDISSIPGPIDTFPSMTVDPRNPSKHWLLPEVKNLIDVIPERLFCLFSQLFGCGIKYITYGDFTLRDEFISALKPKNLTIDISFCWFETVEGIFDEKNVHIFVENALHRTDITEVIRLAYKILKEEEEAMPADQLRLWAAAVNAPTALIVKAKNINSDFLMPPLDIEFHAHSFTMSSLIKTMAEKLGEGVKCALQQELDIGIELQLRSAEIREGRENLHVVTPQTVNRCGLCGLTNVGNTCYMNSALQCLLNIPRFRDQLLYFPVSHYTNAPLVSSVVNILSEMWSGHSECVKTATLNSIIGQKVKRFAGYQQQDACEFVEVLLDLMQEELNEVSERCYCERLDEDKSIPLVQLSEIFWNSFLENNTSFISRDFFHQSKTVFTCLTCEETSIVFDNNLTLSLNIRETKAYNVMVVVQKSSFGASRGDTKGHASESASVSLEDQVLCISLDVHVMDGGSRGNAEIGLKKAIRNALLECSELKKKVSCNPSLDVQSTEEPKEFDYHIDVLETPTRGCSKVYAWARCITRGVTETGSSVAFADVKRRKKTNLDLSRSGGYRIWYFLRWDDDDFETVDDTPIYVEELPFSLFYTEDPLFFSKADAAGRGRKNEESYAAQQGTLNSSMLAAAPVSDHILRQSRNIAQCFLVPYFMESQGPFLPSDTMSNDHDDALTLSPLEKQSKEHDFSLLKIMYYSSSKSLGIDIDEYSKVDGDSWLGELHPYHTIKGRGRKKHKSGTTAHCGLTSMDKMTNISIFMCIKRNCFRVKLPQITMGSDSQRPHSAYLRLSNHGENCNSDSMCTLYDCLEQSMMPDTLTDDNSWYCPHCKGFSEARVQRNVFRVPPCLIISFKAFKMANTYHADKNNTPVDFPLEFDFSPYLDMKSALLKQDTTYRLRSVVYHSGSLNFGHYTAYAFNDNINKWVYFDDSRSYIMDIGRPPATGAYMLFYERTSHAKT